MTGRKRVEGAIAAGILGRLNRQCFRIALKTRNWNLLIDVLSMKCSTYMPCPRYILQVERTATTIGVVK